MPGSRSRSPMPQSRSRSRAYSRARSPVARDYDGYDTPERYVIRFAYFLQTHNDRLYSERKRDIEIQESVYTHSQMIWRFGSIALESLCADAPPSKCKMLC